MSFVGTVGRVPSSGSLDGLVSPEEWAREQKAQEQRAGEQRAALESAVKSDGVEKLDEFIQAHPESLQRQMGEGFLGFAVREGAPAPLERMLQKLGGEERRFYLDNPTTPVEEGKTPLYVAVVEEKGSGIVKVLLEQRSDVNTRNGTDNETVLEAVLLRGKKEVREHVFAWASVEQVLEALTSALRAKRALSQDAVQAVAQMEFQEGTRTPLHLASYWNQPKIVDWILGTSHSWVKSTDDRGQTPLHYAVRDKAKPGEQGELERAQDGDMKRLEVAVEKAREAKKADSATPAKAVGVGPFQSWTTPANLVAVAPFQWTAEARTQEETEDSEKKRLHSVVLRLLEAKAETEAEDSAQMTPFLVALKARTPEEVIELLLNHVKEEKLKGYQRENGHTLLHCAVRWGQSTNIMKRLVDKKVSPSKGDSNKQTALHVAAKDGAPSHVVTWLAEQTCVDRTNVSEQKTVDLTDESTRTPLHLSALSGHVHVVRVLVKQKADVDKPDINKCRPLHLSASEGHAAVVKQLIEFQAKVDAKDADPLQLADQLADVGKRRDVVETIMDCLVRGVKGAGHKLQLAAERGCEFYLKDLLQMRPQQQHLQVALRCAAASGHERVLNALLEHGVPLNTAEDKGMTALHFAAKLGKTKVVSELLRKHADLKAKDREDKTALHWAVHERRPQVGATLSVVRDLVSHNADIQGPFELATDNWSTKNRSPEVISELLRCQGKASKYVLCRLLREEDPRVCGVFDAMCLDVSEDFFGHAYSCWDESQQQAYIHGFSRTVCLSGKKDQDSEDKDKEAINQVTTCEGWWARVKNVLLQRQLALCSLKVIYTCELQDLIDVKVIGALATTPNEQVLQSDTAYVIVSAAWDATWWQHVLGLLFTASVVGAVTAACYTAREEGRVSVVSPTILFLKVVHKTVDECFQVRRICYSSRQTTFKVTMRQEDETEETHEVRLGEGASVQKLEEELRRRFRQGKAKKLTLRKTSGATRERELGKFSEKDVKDLGFLDGDELQLEESKGDKEDKRSEDGERREGTAARRCCVSRFLHPPAMVLFRLLEYLLSLGTLVDWAAIALDTWACLVMLSFEGTVLQRGVLGACAAANWLTLLYATRGFEAIGPRLLPILGAVFDTWTFFFVVVLCLIAATNAFYCLGTRSEPGAIYAALLPMLRLGLFGDFDLFELEGLDTVFVQSGGNSGGLLQLEPLEPEPSDNYHAVHILFFAVGCSITIILMNLLIGVLSNSYDRQEEMSKSIFLRHRAHMCVNSKTGFWGQCIWGCCRGKEESPRYLGILLREDHRPDEERSLRATLHKIDNKVTQLAGSLHHFQGKQRDFLAKQEKRYGDFEAKQAQRFDDFQKKHEAILKI